VTLPAFLARLLRAGDGSMAIETAIVAPVLIIMALGTFEVAAVVSRQQELQSAAAESEIIAVAAASGATSSLTELDNIITTSMDLDPVADASKVQVTRFYRCDALPVDPDDPPDDPADCDVDPAVTEVVTSYIQLRLQDTYTPMWTKFGVGGPITFDVNRTVQMP
jgi:hypothetical protein